MAPDGQLKSENRTALLAVYAALDHTGERARVLRELGLEFDGPLEPYRQLRKAAENLDQLDAPVHRIHLAGAAMKVLRESRFEPPTGDTGQDLAPVVDQLVAPEHRGTKTVDHVHSLMKSASGVKRFHNRWAQVNKPKAKARSPLHPTLSAIEQSQVSVIQKPRINTGLFSVEGEVVSRIETRFIVKRPDLQLQGIAPALLPHNWPNCGDFFCSLTRAPDRDRDVPGHTGGDLTADTPHWCGVYLERVGGCPDGWFPDTFLVFNWDYFPERQPRQLILRYKLAPRRPNDRTVLRIDEGYIQVDRLADGFEVSTLKYALFDDRFVSGGGQTIAAMAPQLGWLDQSINQFGVCAELPGGGGQMVRLINPGVGSRESLGDGLQEVLRRAEAHLRETATSADEQMLRIKRKVRDGTYGWNDLVGDWGDATVRVMRDTARSLEHRIDLARESAELARELFPKRGGARQ